MRIPKTYQRISDAFTIKGLHGKIVSEFLGIALPQNGKMAPAVAGAMGCM